MSPDSGSTTPTRRYDLDWLRVIAIVLLLYFHTGMIFVSEWGFHIKNPDTSPLLLEFNFFLSRWRMALLFFISGVGTSFALGRRTAAQYVGERARRLLVPLAFGMFVIVPPQIYFERLPNGAPYASYLDFYPEVFRLEPYPKGAFSWHHLWFIFYLFGYSVIALPPFLYLRGKAGRRWATRIGRAVRGPGLYALALPLGAVLAALIVSYPGPQNIVDDWASLIYYFLFFVYGYVLHVAGAWDVIEARRRTSLALAFLAILAIDTVRWNDATPAFTYSAANAAYYLLQGFNAWCWVLAILGYGRRYLNRPSRFLERANEGIYPFYILHQTVIIIVGFYVIRVEESILAKFLFTSTVSLAVSWALYDLLIRPVPALRFLFGMKPVRPTAYAALTASPRGLPATTADASPVRVDSGSDVLAGTQTPASPLAPERATSREAR